MVRNEIVLFERYQAHHDRSYQRAANELAKRRKDRELRARGFESQKRAKAEAERREKQQVQRDQMHGYRVAAAKAEAEHRGNVTTSAASQPQTKVIAAGSTPLPESALENTQALALAPFEVAETTRTEHPGSTVLCANDLLNGAANPPAATTSGYVHKSRK